MILASHLISLLSSTLALVIKYVILFVLTQTKLSLLKKLVLASKLFAASNRSSSLKSLFFAMSVVGEAPGIFKIFSDGSIKREPRETAAASEDSSFNGCKSKDAVISSTKPVSARIFLPDTSASSSGQLPVLVFFHGGGFCIGSTTWVGYHRFLGGLAAASQSILLSVDYRLAPENRLPAAYDDCYSSLEWLSSQVGSEPWLERADLSRVFLSGDSAGGNIVHHVVLRAIQEQSCCSQIKIQGLLLIHPYFWGEELTEKEKARGEAPLALVNLMWKLSLPEGSNLDHPFCNFEKAEVLMSRDDAWCRFPRAAMFVAGLDLFKERGVKYAGFLERKGVKVELVETEGVDHGFYIFDPESEATRLLQKQMSEFIHS